jgi:PEP-CTERM motif
MAYHLLSIPGSAGASLLRSPRVRMKYLGKAGLAVAIGMAAFSTALATPIELTVTSGSGAGSSILLPNTGGSSTIIYDNSDFNGWDISLAFGQSRSPALALGALDLTTAAANCLAASCDPLTIAISDIGFTTPVGPSGLNTSLSNNQLGASSMVTQWAYADTSNTYFGSTDLNAATDFGGAYDSSTATLIGTLTVDGLGSGFRVGGGSLTGPYSLTLVDQFCSNPAGSNGTCSGGLSFSTDGAITVPEPGTLALFGAGLLGCAFIVGRRRWSKARA